MDAFDSNVVIYAASGHRLGRPIRSLFSAVDQSRGEVAGVGSVLLATEVLAKPMAEGAEDELSELGALLARLELRPVDHRTAGVATSMMARYRLRTVDAVHLATAVVAGAERFITNDLRDYSDRISEVAITHPEDL